MKTVKKIDPKSMKKMNKQLVLRYLVEHGPSSRTELVAKIGLANSAVWRIIEELVDQGFIEQKEYFMKTNTKKAAVYGVARNFMTCLIVDVQVLQTTVALGFLDGSWEVLETFQTDNFEEFKHRINEFLSEKTLNHLLGKRRKNRIVFSVPGIVDSQKNKLLYAPNLNWHNVDFKEYFGKKNFEIIVDNDSNLSLLAESFFSSDIKDSNNAFFLYLGEGVGGAILINGKIVKGTNFAAGEIGHTILQIKDNVVEVETLLSISKLVEKFEKSKMNISKGNLKERFDLLVKAWLSGDKVAKHLIGTFLNNLALTLRNIGYLINPQIIVFGGSVNNLWENFGSFIHKEITKIDDYGFLGGITFRDTIFKNVSPSLPGCNVAAINKILEDSNLMG
ncbi:ROK family transcriptional regulator [Thermotoga profunda]|uniref:ROK family transcriptional regulator n=1 Tax=Thermotoga profunda TaxID=1508420 RepID=UPI000A78396B|nr:ROK family transcriptional regulator [Thermotoga profunda]